MSSRGGLIAPEPSKTAPHLWLGRHCAVCVRGCCDCFEVRRLCHFCMIHSEVILWRERWREPDLRGAEDDAQKSKRDTACPSLPSVPRSLHSPAAAVLKILTKFKGLRECTAISSNFYSHVRIRHFTIFSLSIPSVRVECVCDSLSRGQTSSCEKGRTATSAL